MKTKSPLALAKPNGGTFTLTQNGRTSRPLPFNASKPTIDRAMAKLSGPMTWKEFKAEVAAKGVTNEMEIHYIDISFPRKGGLGVQRQKRSGPNAIGLTIT